MNFKVTKEHKKNLRVFNTNRAVCCNNFPIVYEFFMSSKLSGIITVRHE